MRDRWSIGGDADRPATSQLNLQPAAYFFGDGWNVGYSGNILADWKASSGEVKCPAQGDPDHSRARQGHHLRVTRRRRAMTRTRTAAILVAAVLSVASGAAPAAAEWNVDLYGGAAWIQNSDLGVRGQDDRGASVNLTLSDLDTNLGFTVGVRGAYWLEPLPFPGFDLDAFYMQIPVPAQTTTGTAAFSGHFLGKPISVDASGVAHIPSATLPLFGFAPELRLRWPLMVDATFPNGRLQPYFTGGPAWAFSLKNEHIAVELGGKIGAGLAFQIVPWLALFSEYRYIFFPGFQLTDEHLTYRANINSHTVVVGLSWRF